MHVFELTKRLIEIESVTGNEKQVALFLRDHLSSLGYGVKLEEAAPERFNIEAFAGKPLVVLTTHLDTVPPFIPFREDDRFIYGRGACDAKGLIAAQIEAAERLRQEGENRIGLLFVVGEERDSAGALFANQRPPGSRYFIDGEPTENRLAVASKGSLRLEITARGRSAHSAYPEQGDSAILKLLDVLQDIRHIQLPVDPTLGSSTCNIGVLEGGMRPNVIADQARAEIMFRSVEPIDQLKRRLEETVRGRAEIDYRFEVPVMRLGAVEGFETTVVSYTSDVPFLDRWGQPFLLGPGSILDAHTDHERISKKELLKGVELYSRLARHLINEG
ncbi:MAG: M20/M25/M40 family metallo-hydrolase [Acidobacteria bacterium]|nr:M20/M25/M40 family metallo-hydrolase [Acidobacteriota bacterium]